MTTGTLPLIHEYLAPVTAGLSYAFRVASGSNHQRRCRADIGAAVGADVGPTAAV
eukprot:CAMPEP_0204013780 /NCGR_PEP_ID=MMETSP0360-20130528/24938_1 /ASSEMBLY_ACC=CAM_ASM_000342 /TAXON_ID=268821 /ORGANISM="Scrippsiella Hangoei, Strain SHTV-5" /LENGTH=54 /DNA_ID=CAMNT_0050956571 /DNA_START=39 /DNA_END=200 /DNA_ORIENTATION=-